MRRLFSSFAHGRPGVGILIMRLAAGSAVIFAGTAQLLSAGSFEPAIMPMLGIAAGLLLIFGLWTPIAGLLVAVLQLWPISSPPCDLWTRVLLAALGIGLALLGPGAFSVDARIFGWKRIDFRDRTR